MAANFGSLLLGGEVCDSGASLVDPGEALIFSVQRFLSELGAKKLAVTVAKKIAK
jgi:hypothetical protein